jgi:hypothetical protein
MRRRVTNDATLLPNMTHLFTKKIWRNIGLAYVLFRKGGDTNKYYT